MQLRNSKGFTLIEIAIVLTIVGLIIGGIWVAASTVFNNNKSQALGKDAVQVIQNTKTLFSSQGASAVTTGFNEDNANTAGIFPTDMISSASAAGAPIIITPFSTNVSLNAVTVATPSTTTVQFQFGVPPQGLPASACTALLTTLGSLSNIQKLGISDLEGTAGADLSQGGAIANSVSPAATAGACNAAGNANFVKVTFSAL